MTLGDVVVALPEDILVTQLRPPRIDDREAAEGRGPLPGAAPRVASDTYSTTFASAITSPCATDPHAPSARPTRVYSPSRCGVRESVTKI